MKKTILNSYRILLAFTICLAVLLSFRHIQAASFQGLGDLAGGSFYSGASGVSADGSVVVGYGNSESGTEAFIWDSTKGMQSLYTVLTGYGIDLTGWTLSSAMDISDDGKTIVGYGYNPDGNMEAWIADLHIITIDNIIDFIAEHEDIEGVGPGNSADHRYNAFLNMLNTAADLIEIGDNVGVCDQIYSIVKKCDGLHRPPDFIYGNTDTMITLRGMLDDLTTSLECE
jgi:probable HAF family extracellular repeat protein